MALGFLAAGPWDHTLIAGIREDTVDHRMGRNLDRDNIVSTVMSTFTSLTIHCARCHNHKFDPITQREYYALQAVFAGVDRADRPFDGDPRTTVRRLALLARKKALAGRAPVLMASLDSPEVAAKVAAVAGNVAPGNEKWQPLDVSRVVSSSAAGGTIFTQQADGSWFVSGTRPVQDTFTLTAQTKLKGLRALRLEVPPDKRLPHGGPGRYDNGNFHLSQFRASARPLAGNARAAVNLTFTHALADHSDAGDVVANALEGKPGKFWSINPRYNEPHEAVFELKEPAGFDEGTALTIELDFKGTTGHQIGRFRLWVTSEVPPAPRPAVTCSSFRHGCSAALLRRAGGEAYARAAARVGIAHPDDRSRAGRAGGPSRAADGLRRYGTRATSHRRAASSLRPGRGQSIC